MKIKSQAGLVFFAALLCWHGTWAQSKPWVDIADYGARAVSTVPQTITKMKDSTHGCTAKSPIVHLREASTFQNGDGVVLYRCGAPNTLSTPLAPTVTPSLVSGPDNNNNVVNAPSEGTTLYNYQIVGRDKDGGLTAASPAGSTSTGVASLGAFQSTVTTLSRSDNTVTVTTSSANGAHAGAVVFVTNSTDATFSGFFVVSAVMSPTQFAYTQGMDTRAGASTLATGGTVQVYNCNHLSWAVAKDANGNAAWQYYIYRNGTLAGVSRPGELVWNDYGPTMGAPPKLPDFVPATPPTSPTNDYLATKILSGAGTTTITLATSAGSTSTGGTVKFDDGPTILAAHNAATSSSHGSVYIPTPPSGSYYYVNSHTILGGGPTTILQTGPLVLNETVETKITTWTGVLGGVPSGTPQFAFASGQEIYVNDAYPGIAATNGNSFQYLSFSARAQGLIATVSEGYGFNATFEYDSFTFPSTDYMGQAVVGTAMSNEVFRYVLFSTNDSLGYGYSLTPLVLARNDIPNADPSGEFTCEHCFFVGRGFGFDSKPVVGAGATFRFENTYAQALRTPLIEVGTYNGPLVFVNRFENDTSITATIANWGGGVTATIIDVQDNSVEAGGPPGIVTGNLMYGLTVENGGDFIGQNRDMFRSRFNKLLSIPVYSSTPSTNTAASSADYLMTAPMHFPSQHTLFWDLPVPTNFNVKAVAGGSLVGKHTYNVKAVGADNGESAASKTVTCATTMANKTCYSTWTPSQGAVSYNVYRDNLGLSCSHVTVAFCSDSSGPCCGPGESQGAGSGLTTIEQNQIITPQLVLSSPLSGAVSSTTAVTASANKVINLPSVGQASANRFSGTSSCSGSTMTISLPITYASQPVILVFDETTKGGANLSARSTSGFTVSCAGATDVFDWMVIGNPN
jgi:hypothetical protein